MVARKRAQETVATAAVPEVAESAAATQAPAAGPGLLESIAQVALAAAQAAAAEHDYIVGDCPILHDRREPYQPGELIRLTRAAAARLGRAVLIQSQG